MSDFDKMEEAQKRINQLLENFKASKILPKSAIKKYYSGLEITYDEFVEQIEKSLTTKLGEEDAKLFSEILEEF